MEPRSDPPVDEIRRARARHDGQAGPRPRHRVVPETAARRRSACAWPRRSRATCTRDSPLPGWHSPAQAWAMTQAQLAWYRAMEERGRWCRFAIARRWNGISSAWRTPTSADDAAPIGYMLSLEGADSIVTCGTSSARSRRSARHRAGALRSGRIRAGHERDWRFQCTRPRTAPRDGQARPDPGCHASL